ncbi:50S ribosomal protein L11 methyltransferase [Desulfomonile tiedjei]|uniref:Ribosomal protein L11 methylase n=1 Tax=Desulfomonile tiedjei (strain ATCC 49306 / DSM 6799 / DCB-1) TaxID=706587 RepID=I4CEV0_DESTA|nr:50S ribosomal protein L11 methyltransferase [Desulfomonile tiedjei]AFM28091.1 ribosomal protein L11 methylase [Desulfomonile tiedjei DSM 6799]
MMAPETTLIVYEIEGDIRDNLDDPPFSFVGLWNEDDASYLFFTEIQDAYMDACLSRSGCKLRCRHSTKYSEWQDAIPEEGRTVGNLIFVRDNHGSPPRGALLLDPSVIFGDGSHPTTVTCIEFMHEIITENSIESFLDLGTGTGILAVAAAAMGVERITAVDMNSLAVKTAAKNVDVNGFSNRIEVIEADAAQFFRASYDLVVGNLPFEVLQNIATNGTIGHSKCWVISGVSRDQGGILESLFVRNGFRRSGFRSIPPWVTMVFHRTI